MLCNRNVLTSTRERCKDEARLQTYPDVPAGMYFGGVAAVLLLHHDSALETIPGAHDIDGDGEPNMAAR